MLARILGPIIFLVLLAAGAIFASILLAVSAVVFSVTVIYLWWKTKRPRGAASSEIPRGGSGEVIEGEYRVEDESDRP